MKRNLQLNISLLLGLIILTTIHSHAQWASVAPVYGGTIANDGAVSFTINNKGYVVSGSSTSNYYVYDSLANSWSPGGSIPAGMGHAFAMSFVVNNKAYIVGGDTSGYPIDAVWEFDPSASTNQWTQKNDFPGGVRDAGFAFTLNNYGYVGAGFDGTSIYTDIWKYDAPNDQWTQLSNSLPMALLFPTSFVIGNKGYILTGGIAPSGVNETKQMWCLDGYTDSLTAKADFGGVGRSAAFSFSNDFYGYVGGGQSDFAINYNDMWIYDAANDQWSPGPNAPLFGAAWSSTFVIGNTAYAGLGAKFTATGLTGDDVFHKFTMDNTTGIKMINTIANEWMVYPNPANDRIYLTGKIDPSSSFSIIDVTGKIIIAEEKLPATNVINIESLPNGIYFVQLLQNNTLGYQKLIKN